MPPRNRGTDGEDDALIAAPIGLSRKDSGDEHFWKEAVVRNASAFTASSEGSTDGAADSAAASDAGLNAD